MFLVRIVSENGTKFENRFVNFNLGRLRFRKEPYILTSQKKQVFYVEDPQYQKWNIVLSTSPRDPYNMPKAIMNDSDALNV